jgi:Zn-dependent protease
MASMQYFPEILALVVGLTMHEFVHALVGHKLGDNTAKAEGRLTINPIAHIDPFATLILPLGLILLGSPIVFAAAKPVPFNPWALKHGKWGAAMVAAAGPVTNLVIAVIAAVIYHFVPYTLFGSSILGSMILINVALFIFNLIPFPPLDGSRVLYAMVSVHTRDIMDRIEGGGLAAIGMFVLLLYFTPLGGLMNGAILFVVNLLTPVPASL